MFVYVGVVLNQCRDFVDEYFLIHSEGQRRT